MKETTSSIRVTNCALSVLGPLGKVLLGLSLLSTPFLAFFVTSWAIPIGITVGVVSAVVGLILLPRRKAALHTRLNQIFHNVLRAPSPSEEKIKFFDRYGEQCSHLDFNEIEPGVPLASYFKWKVMNQENLERIICILNSEETAENWSFKLLERIEAAIDYQQVPLGLQVSGNSKDESCKKPFTKEVIDKLRVPTAYEMLRKLNVRVPDWTLEELKEKKYFDSQFITSNSVGCYVAIAKDKKPIVLQLSEAEEIIKHCPNLVSVKLYDFHTDYLKKKCEELSEKNKEEESSINDDSNVTKWRNRFGTLIQPSIPLPTDTTSAATNSANSA